MTTMLMPTIHSYFAIYTLENPVRARDRDRVVRGSTWDLHATAMDRSMAISHARMLALQPGVSEVQVKQVIENLSNGEVMVKDVKRCRRVDAQTSGVIAASALMVACLSALALVFLS